MFKLFTEIVLQILILYNYKIINYIKILCDIYNLIYYMILFARQS